MNQNINPLINKFEQSKQSPGLSKPLPAVKRGRNSPLTTKSEPVLPTTPPKNKIIFTDDPIQKSINFKTVKIGDTSKFDLTQPSKLTRKPVIVQKKREVNQVMVQKKQDFQNRLPLQVREKPPLPPTRRRSRSQNDLLVEMVTFREKGHLNHYDLYDSQNYSSYKTAACQVKVHNNSPTSPTFRKTTRQGSIGTLDSSSSLATSLSDEYNCEILTYLESSRGKQWNDLYQPVGMELKYRSHFMVDEKKQKKRRVSLENIFRIFK